MFQPVYEEIRQMTIAKVLDFYDHEIRQLDETARQEKYDKMSLSPFRFFRGSSHLFYYDVTRIPLGFDTPQDKPTWIKVIFTLRTLVSMEMQKGKSFTTSMTLMKDT